MTTSEQLFSRGLEALGIEVSDLERCRLGKYMELLEHWNRRMNLTRIRPAEVRLRRLVLEPVWVARQLSPSGHYLDIGSGNGSPSVPWLICAPFGTAALVEARSRRATFLEVAVRRTGLANVRVHAARFDRQLPLGRPSWVTLQGVRLDQGMLDSVRRLSPDARVVWFTRNPDLTERPSMRLQVPDTDREVIIFHRPDRTPSGAR